MAIDGLARAYPYHIAEHVDWCDGLDQHCIKLWLDAIAGMPRLVRLVALLQRILEKDGRLGELAETQLPFPNS